MFCKRIQPNFVCSAGLFSRLLITTYRRNDIWAIFAAKWKGTIYLNVDKKSDVNYLSEDERTKGIAWCYKFDQYILSGSLFGSVLLSPSIALIFSITYLFFVLFPLL